MSKQLSNRRKGQIKWEAEKVFMQVLREDYLGHEEMWFDNNPETWNKEQKAHFDALSELKDKLLEKVFDVFTPTPLKQF